MKAGLERRRPEQSVRLLAKAAAGTLEDDERGDICELLGEEFAETGLRADSEPNERDYQLEELLDIVNRPRLWEPRHKQ